MIHFIYFAVSSVWLVFLFRSVRSEVLHKVSGLRLQFNLLAVAWTGLAFLLDFFLFFEFMESSQESPFFELANDWTVLKLLSLYSVNAILNLAGSIWVILVARTSRGTITSRP